MRNMNAGGIAIVIVLSVALVLIPYVFTAGGEGRYRRGVGWYLDVRSKREDLVRGGEPAGHEIGMSEAKVRRWLISGAGLIVLAIVAWVVLDTPALGVVIGLIGLLCLGAAWLGWRENRYLRGPSQNDRRRATGR
jgi:hypothetical protein